jgi:hypothetical protein
MKYLILIFCVSLFLSKPLNGQPATRNITGQVSFISSQNIYVRFGNTKGISVHDTLYISSGDKLVPVLVVNSLSLTSSLCTAISGEDLPVGHVIIAKTKPSEVKEEKTLEDVKKETPGLAQQNEPVSSEKSIASSGSKSVSVPSKQGISGSISAASYSDFSNTTGADIQRFRYTLAVDAKNIAKSRFSAETYISFSHKSGDWSEVRKNIFNALKIYSLAVKCDIDSTTQLSLGRQINPRIASIGSFDGLQFEKSIKRFTVGLAGGSRPDFLNFGFDPHLLQFGGYLSYDIINDRTYSGTSLAFMEQLNSGKTDRRFLYIQHSGSPVKNLNVFSSFEIDLFKLKNNKPASDFNLTSLYLSMNYRLLNNFTIGGSYDARKNPVYYETFKSQLDSLIENGLRQSYRLHTNIRITNSFTVGLQSSWRFQKTDLRQSKNVSGYFTYNHTGKNYFSATLSGNYIETSYISGITAGITILNSMASGKVQTSAGYSYQDYRLSESRQNTIQHTGKADLYWQFAQKTFLSLNYEITLEPNKTYNRLYLQIMKRF